MLLIMGWGSVRPWLCWRREKSLLFLSSDCKMIVLNCQMRFLFYFLSSFVSLCRLVLATTRRSTIQTLSTQSSLTPHFHHIPQPHFSYLTPQVSHFIVNKQNNMSILYSKKKSLPLIIMWSFYLEMLVGFVCLRHFFLFCLSSILHFSFPQKIVQNCTRYKGPVQYGVHFVLLSMNKSLVQK